MNYEIELYFTNLDNSLYTDSEAILSLQFRADDRQHADLLEQHLQRVFQADYTLTYERNN